MRVALACYHPAHRSPLLGQTPAAPAEQQQTGLFGDFFGTSFEDPRTRRNLAGAAALLEAGGPQMRPVGTGQAVGMAINAMLGQQNEMDKLKKVTAKGFEAKGPSSVKAPMSTLAKVFLIRQPA